MECPVCGGSRKIRLPLRHPASVSSDASRAVSPTEPIPSSKEFACPECAPNVPEERVAILEFHAIASVMIDDPGYEKAVREDVARNIAHVLLRDGFIQFRKGPMDKYEMSYELRGRVGVASTSVVASMEERIAERQTDVAKEVADLAVEKIAAWGSYYTGNNGNIAKAQAIDEIRNAAKLVLAARAQIAHRNNRNELKPTGTKRGQIGLVR